MFDTIFNLAPSFESLGKNNMQDRLPWMNQTAHMEPANETMAKEISQVEASKNGVFANHDKWPNQICNNLFSKLGA